MRFWKRPSFCLPITANLMRYSRCRESRQCLDRIRCCWRKYKHWKNRQANKNQRAILRSRLADVRLSGMQEVHGPMFDDQGRRKSAPSGELRLWVRLGAKDL